MNDTAIIDSPEVFAEKALPLLKEYLEKVLNIQRELRQMHEESAASAANGRNEVQRVEFDSLHSYFHQIEPAIREFNQQVSGMIDQGRISPLTRSELRLRLAELEAALSQLPFLFTAYDPFRDGVRSVRMKPPA